jgi:hypothetical protein
MIFDRSLKNDEKCDFPVRYVILPEGMSMQSSSNFRILPQQLLDLFRIVAQVPQTIYIVQGVDPKR